METKNYFVSFADGSSMLVYVSVEGIDENTISRYAARVTGEDVLEVYHVPQDELQYYVIDARVWVDTAEKAVKLLTLADPQDYEAFKYIAAKAIKALDVDERNMLKDALNNKMWDVVYAALNVLSNH